MGKRGPDFSYQETLMAFALFMTLPRRMHDDKNEKVQELAAAIGRSSGSLAMKIHNLAAEDPVRKEAGKKGMPNGGRQVKVVWEQYRAQGDELIAKGVDLIERATNGVFFQTDNSIELKMPEGKERTAEVVMRANQNYFRNTLLDSYQGKCCLTGLGIEKLLVASHIKPWRVSKDRGEKLNPANGLLLNALHDRAFDQGLITIDFDYRVRVSPTVRKRASGADVLFKYDKTQIRLPKYRRPAKDFIEYHNDVIFQH